MRFSCYGGKYYRYALLQYTESLFFYLNENNLIYTTSGVTITEIPLKNIRKLSVKKDKLNKQMYHIRFVAEKKYHLYLHFRDWAETDLTGKTKDNVENFIKLLQSKTNNN